MDLVALITQLQAKRDEWDRLLSELEVWARVKAQGIDPADVDALGFDPDALRGDDRRAYHAGPQATRHPNGGPLPEWHGPWLYNAGKLATEWFNVVRLKDGTTRPLAPFIRAARRT